MAYLTEYRGRKVQCDSIEELDRILDRVQRQDSKPPSPGTIQDVIAAMTARPQQLLKVVLEKQPITKSALSKLLKLERDTELPGIITGVSKPLIAAGLTRDRVLRSSANGRGSERQYSIPNDVIDAVREGLDMK